MESKEYREAAAQMVDFIANYNDTVRERKPLTDVQPGYLRPLMPEEAPDKPEAFGDVMKDVEKFIMPGMNHWLSPHFHAYFPSANSYPSMLGDMLCGGLLCLGFTWKASPVCTELEVVMMDWLGSMIGLPHDFLSKTEGTGGGVIQSTASEATLVALLTAKKKALVHLSKNGKTEYENMAKLVAYTSDQSHSSVEKAGVIANVKLRMLSTDEDYSLRGNSLMKAIEEDRSNGLVPCCVIATLGTTATCAFDNLEEIGKICKEDPLVWLHVDAAYAGSAFICEEFRGPMKGIEHCDSFNFNPHKWLMMSFDCSAFWVKNSLDLVNALDVDAVYLRHEHQNNKEAPDYRHWQIPLGRKFRSLKVWFVLKLYGKEGLQKYIRTQVNLASQFGELVRSDSRFELVAPISLGLVCFRLKAPSPGCDENAMNQELVKLINDAGDIHLVPSAARGKLFLRVAVCSRYTEASDMTFAWTQIKKQSLKVLTEVSNGKFRNMLM